MIGRQGNHVSDDDEDSEGESPSKRARISNSEPSTTSSDEAASRGDEAAVVALSGPGLVHRYASSSFQFWLALGLYFPACAQAAIMDAGVLPERTFIPWRCLCGGMLVETRSVHSGLNSWPCEGSQS